MKSLFIAAGPIEWGSSRMRAYWPARYMPADVVRYEDLLSVDIAQYDNVIWQKHCDPKLAAELRDLGIRQWWDVCDPSWWWQPEDSAAINAIVDGVVASSIPLADDYMRTFNRHVYAIHDSLEPAHFKNKRTEHNDIGPLRCIWFGVAVNRVAIFAALANLERLNLQRPIELTIFDDAPEQQFRPTNSFPIYNIGWSLAHEVTILAAHDVAVLPPYPGPWGLVKSDNKTMTAYAAGLAVTDGQHFNDVLMLANSTNREDMQFYWQKTVQARTAENAARDWLKLLGDVRA